MNLKDYAQIKQIPIQRCKAIYFDLFKQMPSSYLTTEQINALNIALKDKHIEPENVQTVDVTVNNKKFRLTITITEI